ARSIHFIVAFALVAFFLIHIAMVLLAGPFNKVRSMITGMYRLPKETGPEETGDEGTGDEETDDE
ncbi:MAG: cytochrome b/b6 domain-containing protein, partial [Sphingomonadaceae bacterium]|nr:cytochrome b/b6 domain-containing protein [Sphingomonadaceae bacterium]